jgi:transcriptional regulator with XRE-family HTH domain
MFKAAHGVGSKIRHLRRQKGLTLKKIANLCQCSTSLLSQIERGMVNPSFSTLKSISDALEVSLAELVSEVKVSESSQSSLMRPKERKVLTTEGGVQFQLLTRDINVPFEFILNVWPPGTSTGKELYAHEGEECGLLLEGELEIEINGKVYRMRPGDTITLKSTASHRIYNPGKKKAVAIWVNSIPWVFSTR